MEQNDWEFNALLRISYRLLVQQHRYGIIDIPTMGLDLICFYETLTWAAGARSSCAAVFLLTAESFATGVSLTTRL